MKENVSTTNKTKNKQTKKQWYNEGLILDMEIGRELFQGGKRSKEG